MPRKSPGGLTEKLVEAWLYRVIAPLIRSFEREVEHLVKQQNPTWRMHDRKCEYVRRSIEYVDPAQEPTLRQLERFCNSLKTDFCSHDEAVALFERMAVNFHNAICEDESAKLLVARWDRSYRDWTRTTTRGDDPGISLLAELLINRSLDVEIPHYENWRFAWKDEALHARALLRNECVRQAHAGLIEAQQQLASDATRVLRNLLHHRDDWADEFRIPPVPIERADIWPAD